MSMPSSRLDVATMPRSRPSFSSDSTCTRCSRASEPWCARDELFAGELVEAGGEPFGEAPGVAEHDRGPVRADQLEDARVHVRPDAAVRLGVVEPEDARSRARRGRVRAGLVHVVDRNDHLDVERLARARVDDRDRALSLLAETAEEPRDLVEGALGGREADALRRLVGDRLEPFERQHEVRAALGRCERVDLVDDHRLDPAQRLAGPGGEHQVERLGRGDEDVGRVADELSGVPWRVCRRCAWRRPAPRTCRRCVRPRA